MFLNQYKGLIEIENEDAGKGFFQNYPLPRLFDRILHFPRSLL